MKKTISIILSASMLFLAVFPISHSEIESNLVQTIHVDDDNIEGPWDGSQLHPYQYVQDGIDNASDGDIVYVHEGYYHEINLTCNTSLSLIGEHRDNTIIDGLYSPQNSSEFTFNTIHLTITNFTFTNYYVFITDVLIEEPSEPGGNILIQNNFFKDPLIGVMIVFISSNPDIEIKHNIFSGDINGLGIAVLTISSSTIISHNEITGLGLGILNMGNITITRNNISQCGFYGIMAFHLPDFSTIITQNNFIENKKHASFAYELDFGQWNNASKTIELLNRYNYLFSDQVFQSKKVVARQNRIQWNDNYWDDKMGIGPKMIFGQYLIGYYYSFRQDNKYFVLFIPWMNFDWKPSFEPFNIY
jgi:hypothetical protein